MERDFAIDEEIHALLPKLTADEWRGLYARITADERCDDLVVLEVAGNRRILGDGHNRLEICEGEGIRYGVRTIKVADHAEAIQWVIDNQLSRRNLTDAQRSYYRGKEYLNQKQAPRFHQNEGIGGTAEKLAEKHNVGRATIERDGKFAEGVDTLGDGAKKRVLREEATATKAEISTGIFCRPCRTKGPKKGCRQCAKLRAEKQPQLFKPEPIRAKPPAAKRFDDRTITDALTDLDQLFGDRAERLGLQESFGFAKILDLMTGLHSSWQAWRLESGTTTADPSLPFTSTEFAEAWGKWEKHRREKRVKLTPTSTKQQYKKLAEMGEERAIAALEFSIANGYTGIFEPSNKRNGKPTLEEEMAAGAKRFIERGGTDQRHRSERGK